MSARSSHLLLLLPLLRLLLRPFEVSEPDDEEPEGLPEELPLLVEGMLFCRVLRPCWCVLGCLLLLLLPTKHKCSKTLKRWGVAASLCPHTLLKNPDSCACCSPRKSATSISGCLDSQKPKNPP